MKNKIEILTACKHCVVALTEAAQTSTNAVEALESLPDNPTKDEVAHVNRMFYLAMESAAAVGIAFDNHLQRLQYLLSES